MNILNKLSLICALGFLLLRCQPNPSAVKSISPDDVYKIIYDSAKVSEFVVLDLRGRMDYVRGHLVSAYWVSPDSITQKLPALMNETRPIIIYDTDNAQASALARTLSDERASEVYVMDGGFSSWTKLGYPVAIRLVRNTSETISVRKKDISVAAAHALMNNLNSKFVLVDVRPYPAFAERHIEGALSIPYVPLNEFVVGIEDQNFFRNRPIVIYSDPFSDIGEKATDVMLRNDFTQVYLLKCDIDEWDSVRP